MAQRCWRQCCRRVYLLHVSLLDDHDVSVLDYAAELPPEPGTRRRAIAAILLIVGLVAVGILLILVGSALGSDPAGGCGGG